MREQNESVCSYENRWNLVSNLIFLKKKFRIDLNRFFTSIYNISQRINNQIENVKFIFNLNSTFRLLKNKIVKCGLPWEFLQ